MLKTKNNLVIQAAYFSMEFALSSEIPNFAWGLGVLATDILSSAADTNTALVGMSLIYHLSENPEKAFQPVKYFKKMNETITVQIEDRDVLVWVWRHEIKGINGAKIPLYFLDTNLPENKRWDRDITKYLYAIDPYTRLCQEVVLGIWGVRMLRKLGYQNIENFHMNEGHASFLILERLKEEKYHEDVVRDSCCFTTHTPISAGHDRFDYKLAKQVLGEMLPWNIKKIASEKELHTTKLALSLSKKSNGVSQKHRAVCAKMFPHNQFLGITNGVHHNTWVIGAMRDLFDQYLPDWKQNPLVFRKVTKLPDKALREAHQKNKKKLVQYLNKDSVYFRYSKSELVSDDYFDENTLTITFSRRFVPYKRPLLIFRDLEKLRDLAYRKIQIIFSGYCHPGDRFCNSIMSELKTLTKALRGQIRIAVMEDRNLDTSKLLVAWSDLWLNNPEPPLEASGTSGMKAALNGCINFSVLDGWWIEAYKIDHNSGWAFGSETSGYNDFDANDLYQKLEIILRTYQENHSNWIKYMKHSIKL